MGTVSCEVGGCEELPVDSPNPIEIRMSTEFCLLQGLLCMSATRLRFLAVEFLV